MGYPVGVQLSTLTFSNPITYLGNDADRTEVSVQATAGVVWAATGQPIDDFAELVAPGAGMPGSLTVPFVDQPGFTDQAGNDFTMWAYVVTRTTYFGNASKTVKKNWQPLVGQGTVDFDNLPGGSIGLPVAVPPNPVSSIAGLTGMVATESLLGALEPALSATIATVTAPKLDRLDAAAKFEPATAGLTGSRRPATLRAGKSVSVTDGTLHAAFPGLEVCQDGTLLAVWREAVGHDPVTKGVIRARRYTAAGVPLTAAYTVLTDPLDLRDPMLTTLADGRIVMQYFKHNNTANTIAGVFVGISADNGATFAELSKVPFTWDTLAACAGKMTVAPNGDWLVAAYGRTSATFQHIRLMRSTNKGVSWTGEVTVAEGQAESRNYMEPVLGVKPDGTLMCLIRVADSNGANPSIYATTSTNNGATWSAETSILSFAGGRPSWISLASGGIVIVFRAAGAAGNAMRYVTSWDNGATWTTPVQLGKTPGNQGTYAQPVEVAPGLVGVVWCIEDNAASSSTVYFGYLADGYGYSPAGDDFTLSTASPYPMDVTVVDTFRRADATTLGNAETGQAWTRISGGIGIAANAATQNAGAGTSIETIETGLPDGTVQVAWRWAGTTSGNGIVFRWIDASNYLFTAIESSGGTLKLYKYDGGTLTSLSTVTGMGLAGDTWHQIEVKYWGGKVTVSVGGVIKLSHTLSAADLTKYGSATIAGLRATLDGVKFGNLVVRRNSLTLPALP